MKQTKTTKFQLFEESKGYNFYGDTLADGDKSRDPRSSPLKTGLQFGEDIGKVGNWISECVSV